MISDGFHTFDAVIEPVEWGRATYTVLILPDDVAEALRNQGAKRVEGEINDFPFNLGLSKANAIPGTFLWTGKSLLEEANIEPGETLAVRLKKADASWVEVPDDVMAALLSSGVLENWQALTPGKQRSMLHQVVSAKRLETRGKRIESLIQGVSE